MSGYMIPTRPLNPEFCTALVESTRWAEKVAISETGCHEWQGSLDSSGYGQQMFPSVNGHKRSARAHRVAWVGFNRRDIPPGMVIDHLCRNRRCVNPDHMEIVSHRVNSLRGEGPAAVNATKTHCKRGHEFTAANTYVHGGSRFCRACNAMAAARIKERKNKEAQR